MSEVNRSPYKKAIFFEQLQNVQSNVFPVTDPFVAHLVSPIALKKPVQTPKILLAICAVLALHYGIFYAADHLPTPPLIVKTPKPIAIEIEQPKEEPPKIIEPKLKEELQKPIIPPISTKPQPAQKQVLEKSVQEPTAQKNIEQPRPIANKPMSESVQQTETNNIKTPKKTAEPVNKPTQDNPPVTDAKGYAGYLSNPAPEYPDVALDRGWEGVVMLRVKVSPAGLPLEINLKNGSGKKVLDDAAVKTVKRWKFSPAMRGNIPIEGWVDVPIHFKLPN